MRFSHPRRPGTHYHARQEIPWSSIVFLPVADPIAARWSVQSPQRTPRDYPGTGPHPRG